MPETDESLAEATARELYERYYRSVRLFFMRRGFAGEDATDLAQETFLRAFQGIETVRDRPNAISWLFAIASNVSRNALRNRQAAKRSSDIVSIEDDQEDAEGIVEADEQDLVDRIILLSGESEREPGSAVKEEELERAFSRLLEFQTAEAERFRERFEASLEMPMDAGEQILDRARRLREELEDLAASDGTAENSDTP